MYSWIHQMQCTRETLLKAFSLVFLTFQTTCLVLLMRVSRKQDSSSLYIISTVVVSAEYLKLITCIFAVVIIEKNIWSGFSLIYEQVFVDYVDTLTVLIPAALYTLQNNVLYVAISNLDAVTYQVLYQSKVLTTALFMVLILQRRLRANQVIALFILCAGIVLSQLSSQENKAHSNSHVAVGVAAVAGASFSSGFAGVYFEKILKGTQPSVWMRNIQLAIFGIVVGLLAVYFNDSTKVSELGFFHGYNLVTWMIVILQACGGLGIAFVMKYADNILKGFATGLSILLSSLVSYLFLNDFTPSVIYFTGAALVIAAVVLYGHVPSAPDNKKDHITC